MRVCRFDQESVLEDKRGNHDKINDIMQRSLPILMILQSLKLQKSQGIIFCKLLFECVKLVVVKFSWN